MLESALEACKDEKVIKGLKKACYCNKIMILACLIGANVLNKNVAEEALSVQCFPSVY